MSEDPKPASAAIQDATKITAEAHPPMTTAVDAVAVPKTTAEEDRAALGHREQEALKTTGQRQVNIIWERTQQLIAFMVTTTTTIAATIVTLRSNSDPDTKAAASAAFVFLSSTASLVIGFYFGRTNHQRTGGVGSSDSGR